MRKNKPRFEIRAYIEDDNGNRKPCHSKPMRHSITGMDAFIIYKVKFQNGNELNTLSNKWTHKGKVVDNVMFSFRAMIRKTRRLDCEPGTIIYITNLSWLENIIYEIKYV